MQIPPTPQEMIKDTEERLGAWELLKGGYGDLVKWAAETIPQRIGQILAADDQPLQLLVHELLFDAVTEALQNPVVPTDLKIEPGMTAEEYTKQFVAYCAQIPVRSAKTEEMALPPEVRPEPDQQFAVFLTLVGQQINYLRSFDQRLGISQFLQEQRIPLALTRDDMLDMVKLYVLLQCINKTAQNQVVAAKAQDMSGQIFKP